MKYLVDTHILLWYIVGDRRINKTIQGKIDNDSNILFLSNASLWEIAIKISIGKLRIKGDLADLKDYLDKVGFVILNYDFEDLKMLQNLPFHHQDPFDRLIVAQAKTKSIEIITNDHQIHKYFD